VPSTSTDKQDWSDKKSETEELYRRIRYSLAEGNHIIDELQQINEALAELDERFATLKGSLWPSDKRK
jgi:hypothetical protein